MKLKFLFPLLLLTSCVQKNTAIAYLKGIGSNSVVGHAKFIETNDFVELIVNINNAEPGEVAIHIHEIGDCASLDGSSAGGHWNPTNDNHGKWGTPPFHSGDIGNLIINDEGVGKLILKDKFKRWSITNPGKNNILGRAIIIHAGSDDMQSQPSGAAGKRIACGSIN